MHRRIDGVPVYIALGETHPVYRRLMANLTTARVLLGQDEYCMNYIQAHSEGKLEL